MKHLVSALILAGLCFSGGASFAESDKAQIKRLMHSFVEELAKMTPYMASEKAFSSPEGKKLVGQALDRLNSKFDKPPTALKETPGFAITFGLLEDHIKRTKTLFEKGELEYARMRLNGTTNLCASCHTQTPDFRKGSAFYPFDDLSKKVSFENANFLFVIRRYDQALAQYETLIRDYPKSGLPSDALGEVFRRKLAIFVRVRRNPTQALESLNGDLKNDHLPSDVRQNIKDWIDDFKKMAAEKEDPSSFDTAHLLAYVKNKLPTEPVRKIPNGDPQLLNLLYLSGLLYERLYSEVKPDQIQELLYYLAVCERSLAPVVWYSIPEIYLKECVVRYPKRPFAKTCFNAYEEGMKERFFGRRMPETIEESVSALKSLLK